MSTDFETRIKARMRQSFSEWKPGYDDWVEWSKTLYAPEAMVMGLGQEPISFWQYQREMRAFREAFEMDLGPFDFVIAEGDVASVSYYMTMTHKGDFLGLAPTGKSIRVRTMEFNTFREDDGPHGPLVTELWFVSEGALEKLGKLNDGRFET